eukprot:scaffold224853_cov17-Tisochrysis_lutea.AAC.1
MYGVETPMKNALARGTIFPLHQRENKKSIGTRWAPGITVYLAARVERHLLKSLPCNSKLVSILSRIILEAFEHTWRRKGHHDQGLKRFQIVVGVESPSSRSLEYKQCEANVSPKPILSGSASQCKAGAWASEGIQCSPQKHLGEESEAVSVMCIGKPIVKKW